MANRVTATPATPTLTSGQEKRRVAVAENESRRRPRRDFIETVWVLFCSVPFAVVLNIALALAVMIGTIIPQIPPGIRRFEAELNLFRIGAEARYGEMSGILYWAGFFDLYNSLWFRMLVVLVVFGIVICTLNRWQPTMRLIRKPVVRSTDAFLATISEKAQFRAVPLPVDDVARSVSAALKKGRYRVLADRSAPDGTIYLYGDRDRWSKLVTFVSHAALVLFILVAASIMDFGWREESVYFYPGYPVNVGHGLDYSVRNDGFSIEYYEDGTTIREFRNTLAVVRDGTDVLTKTIIVNDPLRVGDVNYFLVSYQPALYVNGTRNGQPLEFNRMGAEEPAEVEPGKGVLVPFTGVSSENQPLDILQVRAEEKVLTFELTYYQDVIRAADENPPVYARVYVDKEFEKPAFDGFLPRTGAFAVPGFAEYSFTFEPDTTVILEVAKDPGWGMLATLFMVMAGGFTLSLYTTFARCWVKVTRPADGAPVSHVIMAGMAEKNKVSFEQDFRKLAGRVQEELGRAAAGAARGGQATVPLVGEQASVAGST